MNTKQTFLFAALILSTINCQTTDYNIVAIDTAPINKTTLANKNADQNVAVLIPSNYQSEYNAEYQQGYTWGKRELIEDGPSYASNYKYRLEFYTEQQYRYPELYQLFQAKKTGLTDGWMQAYYEIPAAPEFYARWYQDRFKKKQAPVANPSQP